MPSQMTAWQLDVVLGLAFAVLVENGEALLWAVVFFLSHSHRWWSGHSESYFHAHYFTCRGHQPVQAGDESGQQRALRDVKQRKSKMEG